MSSGSVHVREAIEADAQEIGRLIEGVYLGEGWSAESARDRLSDGNWVMHQGQVLVAELDGAVMGSVVLVPPGMPGRQIGEADEIEVRLLAVSPEARGEGLGEALMRDVLLRTSGLGFAAVVLSTQSGMKAAQRLYERLGFERRLERDWRRGSGEVMLVYRRESSSALVRHLPARVRTEDPHSGV